MTFSVATVFLSILCGCGGSDIKKRTSDVWRDYYDAFFDALKDRSTCDMEVIRYEAATRNGFEDWGHFVAESADRLGPEYWRRLQEEQFVVFRKKCEKLIRRKREAARKVAERMS
jgi:hypothetical protein